MDEEKIKATRSNFFRGFINGIIFSVTVTVITLLLLWFLL